MQEPSETSGCPRYRDQLGRPGSQADWGARSGLLEQAPYHTQSKQHRSHVPKMVIASYAKQDVNCQLGARLCLHAR